MEESPELQAAFIDYVASIAEGSGLFADVVRDPERFGLLLGRDGRTHAVSLDNVYVGTQHLPPSQRHKELGQWLDVMTQRYEPVADWADAREHLRPLLRTPGFLATSTLSGQREDFVVAPFTPMLRLVLGFDLPHTTAFVRQTDLARWGVSAELALSVAMENLADASGDGISLADVPSPFPIWQVGSGDGYEASRLALPGWLASFAERVQGNPIAVVPHRHVVFVTGDASSDAVAALAGIAHDGFETQAGPLSPRVYTLARDGETIEPLAVERGHPEYAHLEEARHWLTVSEYAEQGEVLHGLDPKGPAAAGIVVTRRTQGGVTSLVSSTLWLRDVDALLPETDVVTLQDGSDEREVLWHELIARWPGCLEQIEHADPPRWRTVRWPEEANARTGTMPA